jgi:hypothetical protein
MPFPRVVDSVIHFKHNKIDLNINSNDLGPKILNMGLKTFKDLILAATKPIFEDGGFKTLANIEIGNIINDSKGEMSMGPLQILLGLLPENNIKIADGVAITYANQHPSMPFIRDNRMGGYFVGRVDGLGNDEITEGDYGKKGDLQLDDNGDPFQFLMSSSVINNVLQAILGHNTIGKDAPYDMIMSMHFPIDWTSTQLEGAIPSLCDAIGFDKPLSSRFKNKGAPKFIFKKEEMSIKFDMIMELYDQNFTEHYLDVVYHGMFIKFKMDLTSDLMLLVDWESI